MNVVKQRFFFCPMCGGRLSYKNYFGIYRLTCVSCTYIFYENPIVGVACIVLNDQNQILLGRRGQGDYKGLWCIPCGYVEYNEDVKDAAVREFKEETNLDIELVRVFSVNSNFHDPENHTVGIWYRGKVIGGELAPGDDLDDLKYFELNSLPQLAFPTDHIVINQVKREIEKNKMRIK